MPVIIYKKRVKIIGETLSFAFDCEYDKNTYALKIKNYSPNYFDSGDFRIKIEDAIKNLTIEKLKEYVNKNHDVYYLGILDYFNIQIPGLYSIKFESEYDESIYYTSELK